MISRLLAFMAHQDLRGKLVGGLAVLVLIALSTWLVAVTGGTQYPYLHLLYLPMTLAAFLFGVPGGVATGMLAGLSVGPWMPLDTEAGVAQETSAWLYRSMFFVLVGATVGYMATQLAKRTQKLADTYARTLKSFAALVALRDEQTNGHCERVAHNACVLGEALGLPKPELEALYWAGILHDLGKVGTRVEILLKPGKLTPAEYEEIKRHAAQGAELLLSIAEDFRPIAAGIRSHHERWDGQGYPDRLAGEVIPLFGRILAVVDVFEALTSKRPYRDPLPVEEALAYLEREKGKHFDPNLVALFQKLYRQGAICVSGEQPEAPYEAPLPLVSTTPTWLAK